MRLEDKLHNCEQCGDYAVVDYITYAHHDGASCSATVIGPFVGGNYYEGHSLLATIIMIVSWQCQITNYHSDGLIVDLLPGRSKEVHPHNWGVWASVHGSWLFPPSNWGVLWCIRDSSSFPPTYQYEKPPDRLGSDLNPSKSLALPPIPWRWGVNALFQYCLPAR